MWTHPLFLPGRPHSVGALVWDSLCAAAKPIWLGLHHIICSLAIPVSVSELSLLFVRTRSDEGQHVRSYFILRSLESCPSQSSIILKPSSLSFSHPVHDHIDVAARVSMWFRSGPPPTCVYLDLLTRGHHRPAPYTHSTFPTAPQKHSPSRAPDTAHSNRFPPSRTIPSPLHDRPPALHTHPLLDPSYPDKCPRTARIPCFPLHSPVSLHLDMLVVLFLGSNRRRAFLLYLSPHVSGAPSTVGVSVFSRAPPRCIHSALPDSYIVAVLSSTILVLVRVRRVTDVATHIPSFLLYYYLIMPSSTSVSSTRSSHHKMSFWYRRGKRVRVQLILICVQYMLYMRSFRGQYMRTY